MRRLATTLPLVAGLSLACASPAPRTGTVETSGARIHYVVAGSGPAVVLIHGWALSVREWDDQVAALAPHYRVVAFDRRGYGRSTGFADPSADPGDVRALLDTLRIRSAVLAGHSAGADVAIRFAAAIPERVEALVLYGGGEPDSFPVPLPPGPSFATAKTFARQYGVDSLMRFVMSLPQFQPGPHRSAAIAARLDSMIAAYRGKDLLEDHPESAAFPRPRSDVVRRWPMPTLFISGEWEGPRWQLVSDSLVRWMPDARKVLIPGGGHAVHFDEPERFNAALMAFLRDVVGGG
jgi:pimeloyl-ACP methyl ester carboxylesterase